jgi:threonine dehydrogenase-like Zn-dependent dehydrogenase
LNAVQCIKFLVLIRHFQEVETHMTSAIEESQYRSSNEPMRSARIHKYQKPLVVENVPRPSNNVHGEAVLVRVGAAGLCHSDLHLMNGEWKDAMPLALPKTPGHEVAGWIEQTGETVPEGQFSKGDLVAIFGGWGCGICTFCKRGTSNSVLLRADRGYRKMTADIWNTSSCLRTGSL